MKRRIKFNGILIVAGLLLAARYPHLIIRKVGAEYDDILEIAGISLILLGQFLRASARGYKAEHSVGGNKLVTKGPYRMVRNPMYLGIILIGVGMVLAIGQLWALLVFGIGFLLRYLYLFKEEERVLEQAFGEKYAGYKKQVPRLLPGPMTFIKNDIRSLLPLRWEWFRSELTSTVPILISVVAVECWEELSINGWQAMVSDVSVFLFIALGFLLFAMYLTSNEKPPKNSLSED